jgi:hypothetical protein
MNIIVAVKWGLNLLEILACLNGFLHWRKLRHSYWKWFPVYLAIIVVLELTGKFLLYGLNKPGLNTILYLFLGIPLQFLFFLWLFSMHYKMTELKNLPLVGAACYIVSGIIDFVYFSEGATIWWFMSFSYTIGNIFLLILIITFFARTIRSDQILYIKSNIMFWVCLGLLTFYLGTLPFFGLYNTLNQNYPKIFDIYWYIQMGLNYVMYILFTLGFIWGNPK